MFKWNPQEYNQNSQMQTKLAKEITEKLTLTGNERILDLGCGDGKITSQLAKAVPKGYCVGIDTSKDMIQFARKTFFQQKNLDFKLGDASKLAFTNEFDFVISNSALHWVKNHQPILLGIKKALKPNGKTFLCMGGKGNAESILKIADNLILSNKWKKWFIDFSFPWNFYSADEYKTWVLKSGLNPIQVKLIVRNMVNNDRDNLYGWIKTTWMPYLVQIPKKLHHDFINQLIDEYLKICPNNKNGQIELKLVRLVVEASKP